MKNGLLITSIVIASTMLLAFSSMEKNNATKLNPTETIISAKDSVPGGCYEGTSRRNRGFCKIMITNGTLHVCQRDGTVIARWNIVSDKDGELSLKSEYNASNSASWWKEDGKVYLNFNYETYVRMSD